MTPTPILKINQLYFKREDQNPTGSAKDRAISQQVANAKKHRYSSSVISSTGNAAISSIYYCKQQGINLTVFVSPKIERNKLKIIESQTSNIHFSQKPISDAFKFAKNNNAYLLRQSTDPIALQGYGEIATEILKELPKVTSVFIPVGSGTTLLGISQNLPKHVKIFSVQPASNCPISSQFNQEYTPESETLTDALSVKLLPLKRQVIDSIKDHNGTGLIVQNNEVLKNIVFFQEHQIETSPEGILAYSGYLKAIKMNINIGDYPLIVLTGSKR